MSTAEGLPVLPNTVSACNSAAVGDVLTVVGTVANTTPITAANTPGTGIQPTSCSKTGTGTMTQAISLSSSLATFGDALKYTGMAASNTSFYAVEPTSGTIASTASSVTSTGQFWATLGSNTATNNHLFRSAGIAGDEYKPATAPGGVPTWAGNPQRILIDTTTFGGSPVDITVGQTITCAVPANITLGATKGIGLVDYTLGYARLLIFKTSVCTVGGSVATSTSAVADTTHFKVGTLDINAFLGSASIFQIALAKAVLTVKNVFGSPDILALQEVGDQATLQTLADSVNTANSGSTNYTAVVAGTDTINSGYLVNSNTLKNTNYTEVGRGTTYTTASGSTATLWDHPPLVLTGEFLRTGRNYPVTVIDVHMLPRDNSGDSTLGPDIRARRAAQAAFVSALAQQYQTAGNNVIVAGNFNCYEYNDGNVDVGASSSAQTVTLTNYTSSAIALTGIALAGTDYAQTAATCGNVLAGKSSCTLTYVFTPTAVGVRTGTVTVTTNDTKYPFITVGLTGNGVDFGMAIAPSSGSQIAGNGTVSPALTITPLGGFNAAITLTCTFQAVASTCTLPNNAFILTGTTTQKLAITTTSQYTLVGYGFAGRRGFGLVALVLGMCGGTVLFTNRQRYRLQLAVCALLLAAAGLTGCSGKYPDQRSSWTEPGTYPYTVTATDGFLTHTATYTLIVSAR